MPQRFQDPLKIQCRECGEPFQVEATEGSLVPDRCDRCFLRNAGYTHLFRSLRKSFQLKREP